MPLMPGVQFEEYWNALNEAYSKDSLEKMLRLRLDRRLDHLVALGPLRDMTFELLSLAEREGWHVDLIRAAHQFQPQNLALAAVYDKYGLAPTVSVQQAGKPLEAVPNAVSAAGFERAIRDHLPLFDVVAFREGLAHVEGCVCRIEFGGSPLGTGFLVGPDLVMTNYHVMERVIDKGSLSNKLRCRFDYKTLSDGSRHSGVEAPLHGVDWNVCFSKYSAAERRGEPDAESPTPDELDYSVVRLADAIGNQPIEPRGPGAPARGWVKFPKTFAEINPPVPMIIAQHPDGAPLKLAMDTNGVNAVNGNKTRVRYETTTEPGSSGSPCFTFAWMPLALHHYGDPASPFHGPKFNQGVPFALIRDHLVRNGRAGIL
jgi:hypothetical protein